MQAALLKSVAVLKKDVLYSGDRVNPLPLSAALSCTCRASLNALQARRFAQDGKLLLLLLLLL